MIVIIIKQKYKVWLSFFLIIVFIFPLTGCWDSKEPDRILYAQGLGVDYKDGKYIVYVQLMNLGLLAKAESSGGNGTSMQSEIGKSVGESFEDAVFNLYKTAQRRIHWGHLNYIFLTENALKKNILQEVVDQIDRYFQTHYRMWIYATKESLTQLMSTDPPMNMSTYLSRLSDPKEAFKQNSSIRTVDMRGMIISHYQPPHEIILPLVGENSKDWKGDHKPRKIGVINGISIIANNTLKGSILNEDANGLRWMEEEFGRAGLSIRPKERETEGVTITKKKVKVEPVIKNGKVQFDLHIKLEAVIHKLERNIKISQLSKDTKKIIEKEIRYTFRKGLEMDADLYRFSDILYKKDFTTWKKIENNGKIPLKEDSIRNINTEVMIKNGGKIRKIPTLK